MDLAEKARQKLDKKEAKEATFMLEEPEKQAITKRTRNQGSAKREGGKMQEKSLGNEPADFALILQEPQKQDSLVLPTKKEIDYRVSLIEYIKSSVVAKEDYGTMYDQTFLKASGYDKFIHYFKLNVSYPKRDIYEDKEGWHCDVTCRVETPWNQVVEAYGGASMKTMTIRKTRHNMIALADTRAKTRAVRTLMGFSRPSYEEMLGSDNKDQDEWF
ncbi:MAG: hypothetical protein OEL89_00500 [Candidatus Peregrinibacteria bacterium]|nr:hypothetical protein [Candidatus Peregrinibacteria bacterium]